MAELQKRGMGRKKFRNRLLEFSRFLSFIRIPANGKFPLAENVYMSISCLGYLPRDKDAKLKIFKAKNDIYNVKDNWHVEKSKGNVVSLYYIHQDPRNILLPSSKVKRSIDYF